MLKKYIAPKIRIRTFINMNIIETTASTPVNYVPGLNEVDNNNKTRIKLEEMADITQYNF